MKRFNKLISLALLVALFSSLLPVGSVTASDVVEETVSVDYIGVTTDATPEITGVVSNPATTVEVMVGGSTYDATVNPDGSWLVAGDVVNPLDDGVYDIRAVTASGATDDTLNELTVDTTAPVLKEVTPVPDYVNTKTPTYEFSSTEPGVIAYDGACKDLATPNALKGSNIVQFKELSEGPHSDCTIAVTDEAGNSSELLKVSEFVVDVTAPMVWTAAEYQEYLEEKKAIDAGVAMAEEPKNYLDDQGIFVGEKSLSVLVETDWEIASKAKDAKATYTVTYSVTDLAGNTTVVTAYDVNLLADEQIQPAGDAQVALEGQDVKDHEKGQDYKDTGAQVTWKDGVVNIWAFGDLDLAKVGDYKLGYKAAHAQKEPQLEVGEIKLEQEELPVYEARNITVVDTTPVGPVKNLQVKAYDCYTSLTWQDPSDSDLTGVLIYRSVVRGQKGELLAFVSPGLESYEDHKVKNGVTYYYTLVTIDDASPANENAVLQVSATPKALKVTEASYGGVSYSQVSSSDDSTEDQDIKSGETEETEEDNNETSGNEVPTVGIVILLLLVALGLYLLYLQNPDAFMRLKFWGNKK